MGLESPMNMNGCVGTVCLPSRDVRPGSTCWITGWGTLSEDGRSPNRLQEAQVQVLSLQDCRNSGYPSREITNDMLCAQGRTSSGAVIDACQGDSGGPLVCESSGTWTVYGATSWGNGCARARYPGVWARVAHFTDWIEVSMQHVSAETRCGPCFMISRNVVWRRGLFACYIRRRSKMPLLGGWRCCTEDCVCRQ